MENSGTTGVLDPVATVKNRKLPRKAFKQIAQSPLLVRAFSTLEHKRKRQVEDDEMRGRHVWGEDKEREETKGPEEPKRTKEEAVFESKNLVITKKSETSKLEEISADPED